MSQIWYRGWRNLCVGGPAGMAVRPVRRRSVQLYPCTANADTNVHFAQPICPDRAPPAPAFPPLLTIPQTPPTSFLPPLPFLAFPHVPSKMNIDWYSHCPQPHREQCKPSAFPNRRAGNAGRKSNASGDNQRNDVLWLFFHESEKKSHIFSSKIFPHRGICICRLWFF